MFGPSSFFTCRYWALGTCPNLRSDDINVCGFAHHDTGRLASEKDQRGTCKPWLAGTCFKGHSCWYEHRVTGVDGMWQGPITLSGFNLEIANAAAKSGFDTFNHAALYELIWSVKRVALRHCRSNVDLGRSSAPISRDPIYPDRYRPSGFGDNTSKKRKGYPAEPPVQHAIKAKIKRTLTLAARRSFKYKNHRSTGSNMVPVAVRTVSSNKQGTSSDPVDLLSDEESGGISKKQKLNAEDARSMRPEANQSRLRASAPNFQPTQVDTPPASRSTAREQFSTSEDSFRQENHLISAGMNAARNVSGGAFTRQDEFVPLIDLDAMPEETTSTSQDQTAGHLPPPTGQGSQIPRARTKAPIELDVVRNKLTLAAQEMQTSRLIMREAFVRHEDKLNRAESINDLRKLREYFEKIDEKCQQGVHCVDRVKHTISQF